MKKIAAIIVSLCLCVGVLGDVKYTVSSKEIPRAALSPKRLLYIQAACTAHLLLVCTASAFDSAT